MRYISVFSGIEAATVAWKSLGWEAVAFSEIEPFPCAVLKHHYPNVPNLGDIAKVDWSPYADGSIDIVVGGSPCQSFSVAGKRAGLEGASGLVYEYFRILREVHPRFFLWENVPGCQSSGDPKGSDFEFILKQWSDLGYHVAWRILDAQYFRVAQRRRRVFAFGSLRDWRDPVKVLFEPEGLPGDTPPRRKKGQENPRGTAYGTGKASHWSGGPHPSLSQSHKGSGGIGMSDQELFSQGGAGLVSGYRMTAFGEYTDDDTASTLKQRDYKDATDLVCETKTFRYDDYSQYVEEDLARPVMARDYKGPTDLVVEQECKAYTQSSFASYKEGVGTLRAEGGDNGGGSETLIAQCFAYRGTGDYKQDDVGATLTSLGSETNCGGETLILDDQGGSQMSVYKDTVGTLRAQTHGHEPIVYSLAGNTIDRQIQNGGNGAGFQEDISYTLNTVDRHAVAECYSFDSLSSNSMKSPNPNSGCRKVDVSKTLDTSNGDPSKNQGGIAVCYAFAQNQREEVRDLDDCAGSVSAEPGSHQQTYVCAPVAPTIGASGPPYSRPGNERVETEALVVQKTLVETGQGYWQESEISGTLRAEGENRPSRPSNVIFTTAPLCIKDREGKPGGGKGLLIGEDKSFTLSCNQSQAMFHQASVRRLTPKECERLQAFPDDYTNIEFNGKPAPDGARYKALGNSMCVSVMRWIGERIQALEDGKL